MLALLQINKAVLKGYVFIFVTVQNYFVVPKKDIEEPFNFI